MESSRQHKNKLASPLAKVARVAALFALAGSLRAGDRTEYDGSIWVGDANAQNVQLTGAGKSIHVGRPDMKVATYNLKGGQVDREQAIRTARSLGADVLGLTEAGTTAEAIARQEYHVVHGGAGNVLLTKYPVLEHFSRILPSEPGKAIRTALFAKLDVGQTDQWFVLNHLAHDEWPESNEAMRIQEIEAIQTTIHEELDGDAIILGDENFTPDSKAFHLLDQTYDDALTSLGIGEIGTFKGFFGLKRYDYIFVDEDLGYQVLAGGRFVSDGSDHFPVMAVLAFDQARTPLPTVLE